MSGVFTKLRRLAHPIRRCVFTASTASLHKFSGTRFTQDLCVTDQFYPRNIRQTPPYLNDGDHLWFTDISSQETLRFKGLQK
jgi:hypothetical protein